MAVKVTTVIRIICFVLFALAWNSKTTASGFYDYEVIARTGDIDSSGNTITGFHLEAVSINDSGEVAFAATNNLGQSLYIGDGSGPPTIISFANPSSTRTYHNGVQINNDSQVIARDRSGGTNLIRVWEGSTPGVFTTVVRGSVSGGSQVFPAAYSAVFSHPTLSNAPVPGVDPFVAFSALDINLNLPDTVLATPRIFGETRRFNFNEIQIATPLRPMVADDGSVVVRTGNHITDPIRVYSNDLSSFETIADSSKFSRLGRSPGTSDDGRVIAFYGELTPAGAATLQTTPGPGIFAWVENVCVSHGLDGHLDSTVSGDDMVGSIGILGGPDKQCDTTSVGDDQQIIPVGSPSGQIIRVAGVGGNRVLEPGEICLDFNLNEICEGDEEFGNVVSFSPDSRIAASNVGTITFIADDAFSTKGLYASHLEFIRINPASTNLAAVTGSPRLIAQVGGMIDSLGEISDISVYDPVNNANRGDVAFWVSTSGGIQAVLRATPNCSDDDYFDPSENPYINQYNAGNTLDLPKSTSGTKGGNSCGATSLVMLLNGYKFSNFKPRRSVLWDTSEFNQDDGLASVYGVTALNKPIPTDAQNNLFSFVYARDWVKALGYMGTEEIGFAPPYPTVARTKAWLDDKLAAGIPVLVSTTFSSKARNSPNPHGGGHVVLFVGRTLSGDYIVKDPAGDYYAGDDDKTDHYGIGKSCGGNALYLQSDVRDRLARRAATGILKTPGGQITTEINAARARPALAIPATQDPDPVGLLATGFFSGEGPRPYFLWIEDSDGRVSGWLPDGTHAEEIAESIATLNPLLPSDPDSTDDDLPSDETWPYSVSVNNAAADLRVYVQASEETDFSVDIVWFVDGRSTTITDAGVLVQGETRKIDTSPPFADTVVPDVVGQSQADAEATIAGAGLTVGIVTTANSETVPVGDVISQDPSGGTNVSSGSSVDLVVSLGPALIAVPDVVGLSQADAEATIAGAGLTVGIVTTANSETVPVGDVISQDPSGGTNVSSGSSVDLMVSLGPALIAVPDVVGQSQADAEAAILGARLILGVVSTTNSDEVALGDVIRQAPSAGSNVVLGTPVDLVVSLGSAGSPPDAPVNLVGRAKRFHVNLSWSGSPSATKVRVFRRLSTEIDFVEIGSTSTRVFVDNLPLGTQFAEYYMVAENEFGSSAKSDVAVVVPTVRRSRLGNR